MLLNCNYYAAKVFTKMNNFMRVELYKKVVYFKIKLTILLGCVIFQIKLSMIQMILLNTLLPWRSLHSDLTAPGNHKPKRYLTLVNGRRK